MPVTITYCLVAGLGIVLDFVSGWVVVMHTYFYYFPLSLSHCLTGDVQSIYYVVLAFFCQCCVMHILRS